MRENIFRIPCLQFRTVSLSFVLFFLFVFFTLIFPLRHSRNPTRSVSTYTRYCCGSYGATRAFRTHTHRIVYCFSWKSFGLRRIPNGAATVKIIIETRLVHRAYNFNSFSHSFFSRRKWQNVKKYKKQKPTNNRWDLTRFYRTPPAVYAVTDLRRGWAMGGLPHPLWSSALLILYYIKVFFILIKNLTNWLFLIS